MHSVLLVNPPSPFLLDDLTFPNLGVLTVAAQFGRLGVTPAFLDLAGREDYLQLLDPAASYETSVEASAHALVHWWLNTAAAVAFTANTPQMPYVYRMFRRMKEHYPDQRYIIGGPHASFAPQHCLTLGFDQVVLDDGVDGVRQLVSGSRERVIRGQLLPLDTYPLPARDLVAMNAYQYTLPGTDLRATNVLWSQGCPYRCSFCSGRELLYYRKYRTRSPGHILYELDHLRDRYGFTAFQVYDDEVNIRKDWLARVCADLSHRGYRWRAFIKANLFDDEVAALMARAGCVEVCTGVESGSDRILKQVIQKETTYAINLEARRVAQRHGIRFKAFCMVGNPSETREDVELTRRWLLEARPDDFDLTILSPMPGSPIYDRRYPDQVRRDFAVPSFPEFDLEFRERDWAQEASYYKTVPGEYKAWTATPSLSAAELEELRDRLDLEVRRELGLPVVQRPSPFEHSMGQGGA